jgi:hypothetical protein
MVYYSNDLAQCSDIYSIYMSDDVWLVKNAFIPAAGATCSSQSEVEQSVFKGTVSRDFRLLVFFMDQFPPSIWVYHFSHFEFFRKFAEIFATQITPPVSWHRWQMEKIFKQKNVNNFVWAPLGNRVNIYINFCHRCQQDKGNWRQNLPPVWAPLGNRVNIYINFCHRCQQDKGNWRQNLPPVSLIPAAIGEVPQSVARKPPLPPPPCKNPHSHF